MNPEDGKETYEAYRVTRLPDATREDMLPEEHLSAHWPELDGDGRKKREMQDVAGAYGSGDGWHVVHQDADESLFAHRGVIRGDEHIDPELLRAKVEAELGFTYPQIKSAYVNGRPTADRARIRAQIDARLLALSRAGGNMLALARVLGWDVDERRGGSCRMMERALQRARIAEYGVYGQYGAAR